MSCHTLCHCNAPDCHSCHVQCPTRCAQVSLTSAPETTLRTLDAVTSVDTRVYRAAVLRLMCDLRALEIATRVSVICPHRIVALRNKTAHVAGLWDGSGAASLADEWASARRTYEQGR